MGGQRRALLVLSLVTAGLATTSWLAGRQPAETGPSHRGAPEQVNIVQVWDSQLPDLEHRPQALRQWLGKVMVLNFWATWCPPCLREIPGFMRLQQRLGERGLQIVGVALDDPDKVQPFVGQMGMRYPVLLGGLAASDLARAAGNHLGGLPYTVVFDRQGRAVSSLVGEMSEARLSAIVEPLL